MNAYYQPWQSQVRSINQNPPQSQGFFPPFPGPGPGQYPDGFGGINNRLNNLERQVRQINNEVDRLQREVNRLERRVDQLYPYPR